MSKETWKNIEGYEGLYFASSLGKIRNKFGKVLKPSFIWGYQVVHLQHKKKITVKRVHRLILEAFVVKIPNGYEVNHIDGNKDNNRVENLEIVTHRQNQIHSFKIGLHSQKGSKNANSVLNEDKVRKIKERLKTEHTREIAKDFGVANTTIAAIKLGYSWKNIS